MQDRVPTPGQEGRVLIKPEDGSTPFYAIVAMADNPTQPGTPLNKETLLTDSTANLFGLPSTAVPDDVLNRIIPLIFSGNNGGIIVKGPPGMALQIKESNSVVATGNINPLSGIYVFSGEPGTYTCELIVNGFYSVSGETEKTVQVVSGKTSVVDFSPYQVNTSGNMRITSSQIIGVPIEIQDLDIFVVGGGASGRAVRSLGAGYPHGVAIGGGSGRTATILNQNLAGNLLRISIGAGGERCSTASNANDYDQNAGGDTAIFSGDANIVSARGGSGSSGGSAGGQRDQNGGTDGSGDGGQGTTTRAFGEPDGELFAAGGGCADVGTSPYEITQPGTPGGGTAAVGNGGDDDDVSAGDATGIGSGGGGAAIDGMGGSVSSGSGMDGICLLRWGN